MFDYTPYLVETHLVGPNLVGHIWSNPNLVRSNLVQPTFGPTHFWSNQIWSNPNLVQPNLVEPKFGPAKFGQTVFPAKYVLSILVKPHLN